MRPVWRAILCESVILLWLLAAVRPAAAGETTPDSATPTPTVTVEPTRSVRPIQISCEITVEPAEPRVGDAVTVHVRRQSNGLGYPGTDAYRLRAFPLFTEVSPTHPYGEFSLLAVAEGAMTLEGFTMDEFITGYADSSPTYSFSNALCFKSITVGPAPTVTPTQPSRTPTPTGPSPTLTLTLTPTATVPSPTPTFTPTSCVSDTPSIEEDGNISGLRRTISGFNRGLFCFRGGSISVHGAETLAVNVECNTGRYTAEILLLAADQTTTVTVCHHPGICGSIGCGTIDLDHASARTFSVDTEEDGIDETPGDGVCATAGGQCSLRAAVQETNALADDETTAIVLEARTYGLMLNSGDDESAGSGDLDVLKEISIAGAATGSVIDGGLPTLPSATQRVFEVHAGGVLLLSDLTIQGGHGWQGGAVGNSGAVSLQRVTLRRNVAAGVDGTAGFGGGLWNGGLASVSDAAIEDNVAEAIEGVGVSSGGGVWNNGPMRITRSTISGNSATLGGGIYNAAVVEMSNTTISGNTACCQGTDSRGGGIRNEGSALLRNVTVARNEATGRGAGISGSAQVSHSIFTANPPRVFRGATDNCAAEGAPMTSGGDNLDSDGSCGFNSANDRQADPQLRPLNHNGGYARTHALRPDSVAIDTASSTDCLTTDQRGVARPIDGDGIADARCDIGAFEYRGFGDGSCGGDCDDDGSVRIDELVVGVNIVLSQNEIAACRLMDTDGDGTVAVHELVGAVDRLLHGCFDGE